MARGIGLDNRIGSKFLHAGPGCGGSCFSNDTLALIKAAQTNNAPLRIIEAVPAADDVRKGTMAERIIAACGGDVAGKTIAILGLAFKPNTDDMRAAPSLDIIAVLQAAGGRIEARDPQSMDQACGLVTDVEFCPDAYVCAAGAQALVIVTEWEAFRALDLDRIKRLLAEPVIVDLRNIYRPDDMRHRGFAYVSIGRP